ncbi:MAG: flagellin [Tepidisphaeraceae bacterium]|jgi:flagellin
MSRINTNVTSLIAQNVLAKNNTQLNLSLQRLGTGLKINSGADDPAGLIAAQNLLAEQAGINSAVSNAQRDSNIIGTADGGLSEVSSLLTQLQGLTTQAANSGGMSSDEIAANQLQVDSILSTINRVAGSTSFQGMNLLNGNFDYTTTGVNTTNFTNVQVNAATLPDNQPVNVVVAVTQSARTATLGYTGGALGANNAVTLQIAGNQGTQQISFAGGTTVAQMVTGINSLKGATGVSAVNSAGDLGLYSTVFGADQYVSLTTQSGTFVPTAAKATGRDAIVTVNGAAATAKGLNVSYRSSNLDIAIGLGTAFNTAGNDSFQITGGGMTFGLGSQVTQSSKSSIGIGSVTTGSLGDNMNGYLSSLGSGMTNSLSSGNLVTAQQIVDKSITQVSTLRGRIGAFQKFTLGSTINSLNVALENASAATSAIEDTDFAAETSNMTRAQILSQAASTVLAQANTAPQSVLTLLRGG